MVSDEGHMQVHDAIFRCMRAKFRQELLTQMNLFPDILTCMHKMYEDAFLLLKLSVKLHG